jgi:hypothetical protein
MTPFAKRRVFNDEHFSGRQNSIFACCIQSVSPGASFRWAFLNFHREIDKQINTIKTMKRKRGESE